MAKSTKRETKPAKRETKARTRETNRAPVRPKSVTMTGPGAAVAHEPVQAGELVSHAPPTPSMLVQAAHNAGVLCGYRQALDAVAKNLRAQATVLRAPGAELTIRGVIESASKFLHRKAQAELLEACAAAIETEHANRAAEEAQHTQAAQALLAAAG